MREQTKKPCRILLLTSADCSYVGADTVGQGHMSYPANTYIIKLVAPAMLPENFYLYCLKKGFDGIIVMSSGEESPFEGSQKRLVERMDRLTPMLKEQNIDIRRVKLCAICTVCTNSFLREINQMNTLLGEIGPVDSQAIELPGMENGRIARGSI